MERFYNYVIENYTLSAEAKRMLDNICRWAFDNCGNIADAYEFLDDMLSSAIGITKQEIYENWVEE